MKPQNLNYKRKSVKYIPWGLIAEISIIYILCFGFCFLGTWAVLEVFNLIS